MHYKGKLKINLETLFTLHYLCVTKPKKMKNKSMAQSFINAIGSLNVESYRIVAELPNGNIAFTANYTNDVIDLVKEDVIRSGAKIINVITEEQYQQKYAR